MCCVICKGDCHQNGGREKDIPEAFNSRFSIRLTSALRRGARVFGSECPQGGCYAQQASVCTRQGAGAAPARDVKLNELIVFLPTFRRGLGYHCVAGGGNLAKINVLT